MLKLATALAIITSATGGIDAFSSTALFERVLFARQQGSALNYQSEVYDISGAYQRAVDCANNFGMCDIDELLDLSEGEN